MTIEEAIKLIDSGFTKDDILKLSEGQSDEKVKPESPKGKETAPEAKETAPEAKETAPEAKETGADAETVKSLTEQVKSLTETVRALQKEAAKSDQSKPPEKMTADSVIKNFFGSGKGA